MTRTSAQGSANWQTFTAGTDPRGRTGLVRVTRSPGAESDPAWSPEGSRIVYRDSRRGINQNDEIFVMNADGTDHET